MVQTKLLARLKMFSLIFISGVLIFIQACKSDNKSEEKPTLDSKPEIGVKIITEAMEFQMPDTITSGWNTWEYHNKSVQTHFILIDHYPEGITLDSVKQKVLPVFSEGMTLINEGKSEEGFAAFGKLPTWFGEVKWPGGVGLISPERKAETTLYLDPGNYFVECYVKMNTGMFHTNLGMIKELVVVEEKSKVEEPLADVAIQISSEAGIEFDPPQESGTYLFSVSGLDQTVHENFVGHDVNLVMIEEGADEKVLEAWMNWSDPKGLIEPAPEGFIFLGGVNDLPEGAKGYFKVKLDPGKYALISEVPKASQKGMFKTFIIPN